MKRIIVLGMLLAVSSFAASVVAKEPRPEIMGVHLGMSRQEAHARLKKKGTLEKEERKRQEVWAVRDRRVSHLLVGFDPDFRVRYITAIARVDAPGIPYAEVADVKVARQTNTQGNFKLTWEVAAQGKRPAYLVMAHGRDRQRLDSFSVKKLEKGIH